MNLQPPRRQFCPLLKPRGGSLFGLLGTHATKLSNLRVHGHQPHISRYVEQAAAAMKMFE
jgi:hypothetical protein